MLKRKIIELGATHSLMSGSGPSVYGIFPDKTSAENARAALEKMGVRAYFATTV